MVSFLNLCKYDVWIPGNHEFRISNADFRRNMDLFTSGVVLGANLKITDPSRAPQRKILPWVMLERKGLRFAVVGIVAHRYDFWMSAAPYKGVTLIPPQKIMAETMEEVRREKPDFVILAAHADAKDRGHVYRQYPELVLMLAGHTHREVPAREYAPRHWVVQPQCLGVNMAKIKLVFDTDKHTVKSVSSEFVRASELEALPDAEMPRDWIANRKDAEIRSGKPAVRQPPLPKKAEPAGKMEPAAGAADDSMDSMLSGISEENMALEQEKMKAPKRQYRIDPRLFAEAVRKAAGADAAVIGNVYAFPNNKDFVTEADFFNLVMDYGIVVLTLTPEQLKTILKEQGDISLRSSGLDPDKLPEKNLRVAFDAYSASGRDGAMPKLQGIANSGKVSREDPDVNIRRICFDFLRERYPAGK